MKTPETFVADYNGKVIDDDGAYGVQCVDSLRVGCKYLGIPVIPTPNNWADGYWTCKDASGRLDQKTLDWQTTYFDRVPVDQLTDGCWVIWPRGCASHPSSHVAMYYHGQEFGENQGGNRGFCLKNTNFSDACGGLLPKQWSADVPEYDFDRTVNSHLYHLYGQADHLTPVVLSPGLNMIASIRKLDCHASVYSKITGCNFYQARTDVAGQPYGMTFGDISSPISGVYQNVPGQNSTMYFDLETGEHADCTGVNINPAHNIFSPSLIYPTGKNVQYARMVGLNHTKHVSTYAFVIRMMSGKYVLGLSAQELTPDQIATDMRQLFPGVESISIIDGGKSAQMMRYKVHEHVVEYTRDTGAAVAGCIAFIDLGTHSTPAPTEPQPQPAEDPEDEEIPTEPETPPEQPEIEPQPVPVPGWTDPETEKKTIYDRIVALLAVKSIFSVVALGLFAFLVIGGKISSDQFMTVFATVMAFYFGSTYQKGNKE